MNYREHAMSCGWMVVKELMEKGRSIMQMNCMGHYMPRSRLCFVFQDIGGGGMLYLYLYTYLLLLLRNAVLHSCI